MKRLLLLILLISAASAALTINPSTPIKVGDSASFILAYGINETKWEIISNSTNTTECFKGALSPYTSMDCADLYLESATVDFKFNSTQQQDIVACTFDSEIPTTFPHTNFTEPSNSTNTTMFEQEYTCTKSNAGTVSQLHLPGDLIPYNVTANAFDNLPEEHIGNISVQVAVLSIDPMPEDIDGTITVSGSFNWQDGTPLTSKPVEIVSNLFDLAKTYTLASGAFAVDCEYDEYANSGNYQMTVTALYSLEHPVTEPASVSILGLTEVNWEAPELHFNVSSGGTFRIPFIWEIVRGTQIEYVTIFGGYTLMNRSYETTCPEETGTDYDECSGDFLVTAPEWFGEFEFILQAAWEDARGTDFNRTYTANISVPRETSFGLNKTSIIQDLPVGQPMEIVIKASSAGNAGSTLTFHNTEHLAAVDGMGDITSMYIPANEDIDIHLQMRLPYNTTETETGELKVENEEGVMRTITYTFTPLFPDLRWQDEEIEVDASEPNISFSTTLTNLGEDAKDLKFSIECPDFWSCIVYPTEPIDLLKGDQVEVNVTLLLAYVEDITEKTIMLRLEDGALRTAELPILLNISARRAIYIGQNVMTTSIYIKQFNALHYFFIGDDELILQEDGVPSLYIIPARVQRSSNLSSWTVTAMNDSEGLGDVCDVYITTGNRSWLIDPQGTTTTLDAEVGAFAWEYHVYYKHGDCKAKLKYPDVETWSFVSVVGEPLAATALLTLEDIERSFDKSLEEFSKVKVDPLYEWVLYLAIAFAIGGGFSLYYVINKKKGAQMIQPKTGTIWVDGKVEAPGERQKPKTLLRHLRPKKPEAKDDQPFEKLFEEIKKNEAEGESRG